MVSAIIVAAGSSRRMGFDKLFAPLASQPVIAHSLRAFLDHPLIEEVVLVSSAGNREKLSALSNQVRVVDGGPDRCDSVWNGLSGVSSACQIVAIHDGARPLIHADSITRGIQAAQEHGAAALARPVTDTVKRADQSGRVVGSVDRTGLWAMETPQCFRLELLRAAWEEVRHRHHREGGQALGRARHQGRQGGHRSRRRQRRLSGARQVSQGRKKATWQQPIRR